VTWSTDRSGDYLITAWLEDCTVGGCAKACSVQPAALSAPHCACAGEGLAVAVAGEAACFQVTACDRFGNVRLAGGDDIIVRVAAAGGGRSGVVTGSVEDLGRGTYRVRPAFSASDIALWLLLPQSILLAAAWHSGVCIDVPRPQPK
jgi:hypothetical protein